MRITRIKLSNWKNFHDVDVAVEDRVFLVGANASGKSNFLDALRFLRDLTPDGPGLQQACERRGGVSQIRCLAARQVSAVGIAVTLRSGDGAEWVYDLSFGQPPKNHPGYPGPVVRREVVTRDDEEHLRRPNKEDNRDALRLSQTALESLLTNEHFREVVSALDSIRYLHLVPQVVRGSRDIVVQSPTFLEYGYDLIDRMSKAHPRTRDSRLAKIGDALRIAVPQLRDLTLQADSRGIAHLQMRYEHWRPNAGIQTEEQFSDGTLRLIGLLWSLQDGQGPLLIEEPELSLHEGLVRLLAPFIYRMQRARRGSVRQVFVSTHSVALLSDEGIEAEETLLLYPDKEGTLVRPSSTVSAIHALLSQGVPVGDVVIPSTAPTDAEQLLLSFR